MKTYEFKFAIGDIVCLIDEDIRGYVKGRIIEIVTTGNENKYVVRHGSHANMTLFYESELKEFI